MQRKIQRRAAGRSDGGGGIGLGTVGASDDPIGKGDAATTIGVGGDALGAKSDAGGGKDGGASAPAPAAAAPEGGEQEAEGDEEEEQEGAAPGATAKAATPAGKKGTGHIGLGTGGRRGARRGTRPRPPGGGGASPPAPAGVSATAITVRTAAPAPTGGSHARTTVGVGENMTFTSPGAVAGAWTATAGQRTGSGSTFFWIAPGTAGSYEIGFTPTGGARVALSMTVIAPSRIVGHHAGNFDVPSGQAGGGMYIRMTLHPLTVSFGGIKTREIAHDATGITGYFGSHFTAGQLRHAPSAAWEDIRDNNEPAPGRGDTAAVGGAAGFLPGPWVAGTYGFPIPNNYKSDAESEEHHFFDSDQRFVMLGAPHAGRVTVSKFGITSNPRDPT